ncbi:phosphonate metabolism protein/1,5-bisphosphokinase (PRPP-forming) PhnN [Magnetovibrio blakemorei]|uniref:ribose 1,5-bisphosphate phosphokinase n=1 Tax=Magnetovibrio blakemorei TaxID=28181 RepID=A0A1E5Q6X3_9PROT|nr:phosphonate metabolism protein/1,5-bisphosphokinase (PRPP-forming) PhnN [Magnetovibrio blakemorei]OEJ66711.1 phosphonate metabolism protein/1,5-bisphosphokinase (PRPP-forming) PhnN [Magnetovibrio blakemorei]
MSTDTNVFSPFKTPRRGTLFLVIGPSGVGKNSLISEARAKSLGEEGTVFPRLYITQPEDIQGDAHIPLSAELFETMLSRGDMLLEWRERKLRYGVPKAVAQHLERGRNVVVSVSRTVVDDARTRFKPVKVLYINVDENTLSQRLKARGRESNAEIKLHVQRAHEYLISGDDVVMIDNNGELADTLSSFLATIRLSPER